MNDLEQEIIQTLTEEPNPLAFQEIQPEEESPLNQAVKEKDIAHTQNWNVWKPEIATENTGETETLSDAPEQEIEVHTDSEEVTQRQQEKPFQIPKETAKQSANALLGMANNMLEVGGGFIIKIKKHKEFYDFEDVVTLIDEQNSKNIQRIKLSKEDKALLRPLIMAVIQEKATTLTPTQQLMGAIVSILIKKAQIVMQVRAENTILVDRILDIIKAEKQGKLQKEDQETIPRDADTIEQEKEVNSMADEIAIPNKYIEGENIEEFTVFNSDEPQIVEEKSTSDDKE